MAEVTRTTVVIYGEEYPLRTDLPDEVVQAIARLVDSRMRLLAGKHPRVPAGRLAVLACMTLAEELLRLQAEHEEALRALQAQWRRGERTALRGKTGAPR
jgi:cell division protein ZapA